MDALAPGCSADRSGSVQIGDWVVGVDGRTELSAVEAKELILGRQGTYTTISFRRSEGSNVRTFKVQLMRGSADYIFLVECLRGLEHQIADLQAQNEELRSSGPAPASNVPRASDGLQQQLIELQAENDWLKEKHRAEIGELLSRIEHIEAREQMKPEARSIGLSTMSSPRESFKLEDRRAQRSAPPPADLPVDTYLNKAPTRSQPRAQRSAAPPAEAMANVVTDDVPIMGFNNEATFNDSQETKVQRTPRKAQRSSPPSAQQQMTPTARGSSPTRVPYAASVPRARGPSSFSSPHMGPPMRYRGIGLAFRVLHVMACLGSNCTPVGHKK